MTFLCVSFFFSVSLRAFILITLSSRLLQNQKKKKGKKESFSYFFCPFSHFYIQISFVFLVITIYIDLRCFLLYLNCILYRSITNQIYSLVLAFKNAVTLQRPISQSPFEVSRSYVYRKIEHTYLSCNNTRHPSETYIVSRIQSQLCNAREHAPSERTIDMESTRFLINTIWLINSVRLLSVRCLGEIYCLRPLEFCHVM